MVDTDFEVQKYKKQNLSEIYDTELFTYFYLNGCFFASLENDDKIKLTK